MKIITFLSLHSLLLFLGSGTASAEGTPAEVPIFVLAEPDRERASLPPQPIVPRIIQLIASESGLNLVVRPYPWPRALIMAERGDGLLYGAAITASRKKSFLFTSPFGAVNQWLVSVAPTPMIFERWEDLRGKRISIMSGGKFSAEFEARRDTLFAVEQSASSMTSRMSMLRAGRVDAVMIASYLDAARLEEKLNCLYPGKIRLMVSGRPIDTEPMMIAVPRNTALDEVYPALEQAAKRLAGTDAIKKVHVESANPQGCSGPPGPS